MLTLKAAQQLAREAGCTLKANQFDEYRVNLRHGSEATAYYTSDLNDAVNTARAMGIDRGKGYYGAPHIPSQRRND